MNRGNDMVLLRLKWVMKDTDRHDNDRYYFRRNGRKIRLRGEPDSPEFMAQYNECKDGRRKLPGLVKDPASFDALLLGYYRSHPFKKLTKNSQRVRRNILERFAADNSASIEPNAPPNGELPYARMEKRHVLQARDAIMDKPGAATNLVKALRHVFAYAVEYDHVKENPAAGVAYLSTESDGFHSWTIDEVRQFEAFHAMGSKARLAMALLLYTGQRRSDVVTFGKQMIRDGRLHYTQKKTGKKMATLVIKPLVEIIAATPSKGMTFLETHFGMPYTSNGFGNAFREWCDLASLPQCSAHGLRKALGARLAELGATAKQIQNALGHETLAQASLYTKAADEMIGSDAALELFENGIAPPILHGGTNRRNSS